MNRPRQTFYVTVLSAALVFALSMGMRQAFGLFLIPMTQALDWGRESFVFPIAVMTLSMGFLSPLLGALADRYGPGRVIGLGGVLWALGLYGMSVVTSPLMMLFVVGGVIGLGTASTSAPIAIGAVGRKVSEEERSRALGIVTAGGSVGQLLLLPLGQAFISWLGWQRALLALAAIMLANIPAGLGLSGHGRKEKSQEAVQTLGEALREARGHGSYLMLTGGFFVCGFHVSFVQVHLPAYVVDLNFGPQLGVWMLTLLGLFNILGSYAWGSWGGRYSKKRLLSTIYFSRAMLMALLLWVPKTEMTLLIFAALMGFLWLGTVPLTSSLVGQMLGVAHLSTLFGIVFASHQVGGFWGAWLGGKVFDATQSYDLMWYVSIVLGLLSAGLHAPIDEKPVARLATRES